MDDVWRVISQWQLAGHEELELLCRMVLACFMGYVIGYERMNREKSAGMRTHSIVCLGAALLPGCSGRNACQCSGSSPHGDRRRYKAEDQCSPAVS